MNSEYINSPNETKASNGLEVAIIGMAGRFPGAADIDEFWENLKKGSETITFFTDEELIEAGVSPDLLQDPNYVKARGILENFDGFDAAFFDYIPAEAFAMAPQMRLFHECVWTALENAGYMPEMYKGRIGLYAGASSSSHWETLIYLAVLSQEQEGETGIFSLPDMFSAKQLSNKDNINTRLSYKLHLTGPSYSVQTACSTSLVTVHMAVQGLINGECEIALAGGTAVNTMPRSGYFYQEGMIMSPDGHNRSFDARAKGTVAGDGVGAVVLKLLDNAREDGDHIYAVIKGTAVNNDGGRKVGYTAPSVEGQAEVISTAQYIAEVDPETVTYIEAHGTATELGDPVEIDALKMAFNTVKKGYCALGSVKSNVGHLDAAAGITGFIKTVLALNYGLIPPSLHHETPNPKIDFENSPFYVNTKLKEWQCEGYPRRAGVSSFGIGGTNAHVVLEEYTKQQSETALSKKETPMIMLLSARTSSALAKMTENLAAYLKKNLTANPADVAYTLQVGRKAFEYRRFITCSASTLNQTIGALTSPDTGKVQTARVEIKNRPLVFMFPGVGSEYINMGADLYRAIPVFRDEMNRCFKIIASLTGYNMNVDQINENQA
ncbi:MAG TPA: type I polyketide synthase, partial [Candidatus Deferrimicrobium sp.]|nr:type I polyketide synthase [Candidatus Deferrimicrobium sp.]